MSLLFTFFCDICKKKISKDLIFCNYTANPETAEDNRWKYGADGESEVHVCQDCARYIWAAYKLKIEGTQSKGKK